MSLKDFSVEELEKELTSRKEVKPLPRICSKCSMDELDSEGGLTSIRVTVSEGEEGYAEIVQLLCYDCTTPMLVNLLALGFKDHRHGGINFLEDDYCPGYEHMEDCPTPTEFGTIYINNSHLNDTH